MASQPRSSLSPLSGAHASENEAAHRLVEKLFFAYRDFVADADAILETCGFGRAHHRVLHFVGTRPDLTVSDLLTLLRITKQSLNRVMRDLVATGYMRSMVGTKDRRLRHLYLTEQGRALHERLLHVQTTRIARALAHLVEGGGSESEIMAQIEPFLDAMTEPGP
jgi:DNA-binding MarR family transcriptional regulator